MQSVPQRRRALFVCDAAGRSADPTGTGSIRKSFEAEAARRMRRIRALARAEALAALTPTTTERKPFVDWFRAMVQRELVGTRSKANGWWRKHIEKAFRKGGKDAASRVNKQVQDAPKPKITFGFGEASKRRVDDLASRTYTHLSGVTEDMSVRIGKVITEGMREGLSGEQIARKLTEAVDGMGMTRARTIARTETIGAHAEGSLAEYEDAGVAGVSVIAEFSTAGDNDVCPECEELEGNEYSLSEARGIIPVHPNCRCAWTPVVE